MTLPSITALYCGHCDYAIPVPVEDGVARLPRLVDVLYEWSEPNECYEAFDPSTGKLLHACRCDSDGVAVYDRPAAERV